MIHSKPRLISVGGSTTSSPALTALVTGDGAADANPAKARVRSVAIIAMRYLMAVPGLIASVDYGTGQASIYSFRDMKYRARWVANRLSAAFQDRPASLHCTEGQPRHKQRQRRRLLPAP